MKKKIQIGKCLYLIKYHNCKEEATGREVSLLQQSGVKVKVLKKIVAG